MNSIKTILYTIIMSYKVKSCELLRNNLDFKALSPTLQSSIKKIIEKKRFSEYEVIVKKIDTQGDNLLGKLYEIDIKCTNGCEDTINIFVKDKKPMKNMTIINVKHLYVKENLVYKDLSKIITNMQDQANIPSEIRFKIAKVYDETSNDIIILENLREKGFKTYGKAERVSIEFLELGVKELAKLHALSFVIENKLPEYFKENLTVLESPFIFNDDWDGVMRDTCTYISNLYDDDTKVKIEKFVPVLLEKLPKYQKDKTNVCTLSHGDYKKNNIMVRSIDGEPVVPIDYQFFNYGCPIRDLFCFIFTSSDQELRKKHLTDLKELYFETLSLFLKYFNMDVETVYPRGEFERIYTEWLDYGLMITIAFAPAIFGTDTEIDLDNKTIEETPVCISNKYDYILRGLIDDFVKWGIL